jgi:hypothetical protein
MRDYTSRESRVRTPVKGLRQRLRIALRAAGVTAKFRTDHVRRHEPHLTNGSLIVMSKEAIALPFHTFEGYTVYAYKENEL